MPTSLVARLCLLTGVGLVFAFVLQMRLHGQAVSIAELINLALWASFCAAAPFLDNSIKKAKDDAFIYYLGVSGLRMLAYMGGLGLALFYVPALRDRVMVLTVTSAFLCYTVVEVTSFVRKLREIFRSTP